MEITRPASDSFLNDRPFLIGLCVFLVIMEVLCLFSTRDPSRTPDFRAFYAGGYIARTHPSLLYDVAEQQRVESVLVSPGARLLPFLHLSYEALLYLPFSFLRYKAAYGAFIVFNVLLLVAILASARQLFSQTIPFLQPRPGLAMFIFLPLIIAVFQGQDSVLFLLLCCLARRDLKDGREARAGALLALGLYRFQLAIPLVVVLAARRGRRFLLGLMAGAIVIALVSVALVGTHTLHSLLPLLVAGSLSTDQSAAAQQTMSIYPQTMPNLMGLLFTLGTSHLAAPTAFVVVAGVSAIVLVVSVAAVRKEMDEDVVFAIATLCSVLVSYHLNVNDATLLLLPIMIAAAQQKMRWLAAVCFVSPALLAPFGAKLCFLLAIPSLILWAAFLRRAKQMEIASPKPFASTPPLYT